MPYSPLLVVVPWLPPPSHRLRCFTPATNPFSSVLLSFSLLCHSCHLDKELYYIQVGTEAKSKTPLKIHGLSESCPFLCYPNTAKLLESLASVMSSHFMSLFLSSYSTPPQLFTWLTTASSLKYFLPWHHSCHTDCSVSFLAHFLPKLSL